MKRYWLVETFRGIYFVYDSEKKVRTYASNSMESFNDLDMAFNSITADHSISCTRAESMASSIFKFDSFDEVRNNFPEYFI